jgi:hypothetical protein
MTQTAFFYARQYSEGNSDPAVNLLCVFLSSAASAHWKWHAILLGVTLFDIQVYVLASSSCDAR